LTATWGLGWVALANAAEPPARLGRIGYLSLSPGPSPRSDALRDGLRELGYLEGRSISIDYRWADGDLGRLRQAAAELVRSNVDMIVTGGPAATLAAKNATATIPIVMAVDYDPVGAGFVESLAHPGGNITGLSVRNPELSGKRLELLREIVPSLVRVAVLLNPAEPNASTFLSETQRAATKMGLASQAFELHEARELSIVIETIGKAGFQALAVLTDPVTLYHRAALAQLAGKYRIPAVYSERLFVEDGGLMSYGASDRELHRQAASYVDKILKGTPPSSLPVQQPTKFELVINRKAARELGLTVSQSLLLLGELI
jgi:putative ABC transport system substrate-binding protein